MRQARVRPRQEQPQRQEPSATAPPVSQRRRRLVRTDSPISIFTVLFLIFLVLLYWLVARQIEQIDLDPRMPLWWQNVVRSFPLLGYFRSWMALVLELFSLNTLRHFIPVVVGSTLGYFVTVDLLRYLYDLPEGESAQSLFTRLRGSRGKPEAINRLNLVNDRISNHLHTIGGPGRIAVTQTDIVITETNGRFDRVLGAGVHTLKRFEYVHNVLDLQDQKREKDGVRLITKEGIDLITGVKIVFRIHRRNQAVTDRKPYPFDSESARAAAYTEIVTANGITRWDELPLLVAIGELRQIVGQRHLDTLVDPLSAPFSQEDRTHTPQGPHRDVERKMRDRTQAALEPYGIEVVRMWLDQFIWSDEIHDTLFAYWQAFGDKSPAMNDALTNSAEKEAAQRNRIREQMIQSVANGLAHMQDRGRTVQPPRPNPALMSGEESAMRQLIVRMNELLSQIDEQERINNSQVIEAGQPRNDTSSD